MQPRFLEKRVHILERTVEGLPESVSRVEVRLTGVESRLGGVESRLAGVEDRVSMVEQRVTAVEGQILDLRAEMRGEFSAVRKQIEDTNTHMRVLHEDVIERLKVLGEQFTGRGRKRRRS